MKKKAIHILKFSWLYDKQNRIAFAPALDSKKFILNPSKHIITDSEAAVLVKGLNFLVAYPHINLDMACDVKSIV
jgi:hypothetical protein